MNIQYKKKDYLQQKSEFEFYKILKNVVTPDIIIAPQVHLERIIEMHCEPHGAYCKNYFYHGISELSFDFVLFDRGFKPLLAIELDDESHDERKRKQRDAFVREICSMSQLELLRVPKSETYDIIALEKEITERINLDK
jgi:hypothetical protein